MDKLDYTLIALGSIYCAGILYSFGKEISYKSKFKRNIRNKEDNLENKFENLGSE